MGANRRHKGYSLLETVIACFIFITVLIGLMGVWNTHSKAIGKARSMLIANELSERVMEKCLAARYETLPRFHSETETFEVEFLIKGQRIVNTFTTLIEVSDEGPEIRNIKVTVSWEDTTGPRKIELHSQVHRSA